MRRLIALLVCLPLSVGGVLLAHQASYGLVASGARARQHLLEHTGHGYLQHLPLVVATLLGLVLVGLGLDAICVWRKGDRTMPRAWQFAALAPVGFVVQEHVERLVHDGSLPLDAWHEPSLWIGVLLQLPLSVFAWLVALALFRTSPRIVAGLNARLRPPRGRTRRPAATWSRPSIARSRVVQLATCAAGRAPPHSV